ncbi:unnamed protein product [Acanthoscelides obtectus]|uniref:BED-type domain-containing protein n=1 Tax=Acanthoscelides obtectus TaxID=200917 RepID=A0A9P0P6Y1_ACAOB|nr:unnamed protein product [Acanthoscelides obtectus]CAK1624808.1 hypothetical protein AOBTE_LOCUS2774 [Acanthoscelides obtectus]
MESPASGSGESQTQRRSVIWMHFTNISEANAKSNLCKNIYSHKNGNIGNLRKHLKTKHPTLSLEGERAKRRVEDENMPRCKRNLVSGIANAKQSDREDNTNFRQFRNRSKISFTVFDGCGTSVLSLSEPEHTVLG